MREFLFLDGNVWLLADPNELAMTTVNGQDGLLLFSDEDLAARYAEDSGIVGKQPMLARGRQVLEILRQATSAGVTVGVVDATFGKKCATTNLQRMLDYVERELHE